MMRWAFTILAMLILPACSGSTPSDGDTSPKATAHNEDGSVVLDVYCDVTELTTVDQLVVTAELSRSPGAEASIEPTDWEAAGWSLVSQTHTPETLRGGLLLFTQTITLEPFLDGEYRIPSIVASAGKWKIATDPIGITVSSVLDPADTGEIAVTTELLPPSEPHERDGTALVLIGIGAGLIFAGAVFWWTGRTEPIEPTPREQLEEIAEGHFDNEHDALALVHRLVDSLGSNERLGSVLEACNRARYMGSEEPAGAAKALANEALNAMEGV